MSRQVVFALVIEAFGILLTSLLWVQPRFVFVSADTRWAKICRILGGLLLMGLFVWSFILGGILVIHRMTLSI